MAKKSDVAKAQAEARAAEAKAKAAAAEREARTAEAKAAAEKAEAEAKAAEAKARVDEINARAHADETKRADEAHALKEQQDRDADPLRQAWKVGTTLSGPFVGMYAGHKLARAIEARDVAKVKKANVQIAALGEKAGNLLDLIGDTKKPTPTQARKLVAYAESAKSIPHGATPGRLGIRALRGPLGLAAAAALLFEAGVGRYYLAPNTPNEYGRDAINTVASSSLFIATTLVGERVVQNVTMKHVPSATAIANITAAGEIGGATLGTVGKAAVKSARVFSRALPGIGLAVAIGGALYAGVRAARSGESPFGIARETALGAIGLDGLVPPPPHATAYLNNAAEQQAALPAPSPAEVAPASAAKSDGVTAAYVRRGRNGGTVNVQSYSTPRR